MSSFTLSVLTKNVIRLLGGRPQRNRLEWLLWLFFPIEKESATYIQTALALICTSSLPFSWAIPCLNLYHRTLSSHNWMFTKSSKRRKYINSAGRKSIYLRKSTKGLCSHESSRHHTSFTKTTIHMNMWRQKTQLEMWEHSYQSSTPKCHNWTLTNSTNGDEE